MTGWEADLILNAHPGAGLEHVAGNQWKATAYGRTITSTAQVVRVTLDRWRDWTQVARISEAYAGRKA